MQCMFSFPFSFTLHTGLPTEVETSETTVGIFSFLLLQLWLSAAFQSLLS